MKTIGSVILVAIFTPSLAAGQTAEDPASYLPSRDGPIGLYQLSTAEVGPLHHLRLGVRGEFFATDDFLVSADRDTALRTAVAAGFTALPHLELFAAVLTSSNRNERVSEPGRGDPEVIKS